MCAAERERFGDPMAHLVRKRKAQAQPAAPIIPAHMAKQMRKSGFMVPQVGERERDGAAGGE